MFPAYTKNFMTRRKQTYQKYMLMLRYRYSCLRPLSKYYAMQVYGGVQVWLHAFLTSPIGGSERSTVFAKFIECIISSLGLTAVLDVMAKRKPVIAGNRTQFIQPAISYIFSCVLKVFRSVADRCLWSNLRTKRQVNAWTQP